MKKLARVIFGVSSVLAGIEALSEVIGVLGDSDIGIEPQPRRRLLTSAGKATFADVHSIDDRIRHIKKMIAKSRRSPLIVQLSKSIVNQRCGDDWCIPEKNHEEEIKAIFHAVRKRARYTADPYGVDLFQSAEKTLEMAGGDCDDYAILLCSLLLAIGYPVMLRVIRTKKSSTWDHIFVRVGIPPRKPTRWISLDASLEKPPGWQAPASMVGAFRDFKVI